VSWFPVIRWDWLDDEVCELVGCNLNWRWKGLSVEWRGAGIILFAKPVELRNK